MWPLGRHFTSLITQPRPSGSRDSHSACLNSPGSQVLRGTAGLALGFRNCNSTPVKPFTTVRGQEGPGEGMRGPRVCNQSQDQGQRVLPPNPLVFSPSDFTSRWEPVLGVWLLTPILASWPSSCSLLSPSRGGGHSLPLLPFFLVGGGSRLWAEPGLRGQVTCWGPGPVTAPSPGSCCKVVGPEAH